MKNYFFTFATVAAITAMLGASAGSSHDMGSMAGMDMSQPMGGGGNDMMRAMANHMRMTELRPTTPQDEARAREIITTLRSSIVKYRDYRVALAQGMRIFLPGIRQDVYHFTDYPQANLEYQGRVDLRHPGSLLYLKDATGGYTLIGAMYSAPAEATPNELDQIVPLGIARWHVHTNICLPSDLTISDILRNEIDANQPGTPGMLPVSNPNAMEMNHRYGFMADGRFGFEGKIYQASDCRAAGGHLVDQAFGWMVHVYPFSGDDLKVAFGMEVPKLATTVSAAR